jgi:predicted Rossmann fold flavoprotein
MQQNKSRVIVIGGGASGMVASIVSARLGHKVTIIEKLNSLGKKILATGNGRCNISNLDMDFRHFYSTEKSFFDYALKEFDLEKTNEFFEEIGVTIFNQKDTKLFPLSLQASSVVENLEYELKRLNIEILTNINIKSITKKNNNFLVDITDKKLICDKVVIATGGLSVAHLGSNGDGYKFAKSFGHNIIKTLPTLVQLKSKENYLKRVAGVKVTTIAKLIIDNKTTQQIEGDVLFAKYGISGNAVLDISRNASIALSQNKKVEVSINLLSNYTNETLDKFFIDRFEKSPKKLLSQSLIGVINKKLIPTIVEKSVDIDKNVANLSKSERKKLISNIVDFKIPIYDTQDFDKSEVTIGGIDCKDVDKYSLESKKIKGLYFCGEVLDVDGDCGGYNLQWAWSSGYIVGKSI